MGTMKFDPADVHAWLDRWTTQLGASPFIQLRSGPPKASTAATATGTLIREIALPSSPFTSPFNGVIGKSGTWQSTSGGTGVIGHMLILNNAKTVCKWVGSVTQAVAFALTANAGINTFILTVADTTAITVGQGVDGIGVQADTVVAAKTATTITLSKVLSGAMFTGDTIVVGDTSGDALSSGAYVPESTTPVTVQAWSMGWADLI